MPSAGRRRPRRRAASFAWEMAFEAEVRQLPARHRAGLLAWLQHWRSRPRRVFWVMDPVGRWQILI